MVHHVVRSYRLLFTIKLQKYEVLEDGPERKRDWIRCKKCDCGIITEWL